MLRGITIEISSFKAENYWVITIRSIRVRLPRPFRAHVAKRLVLSVETWRTDAVDLIRLGLILLFLYCQTLLQHYLDHGSSLGTNTEVTTGTGFKLDRALDRFIYPGFS